MIKQMLRHDLINDKTFYKKDGKSKSFERALDPKSEISI